MGFHYLILLLFFIFQPIMLFAFECHDTCGVLSVHGLPGILGWMVQLLLQIADSDDLTTYAALKSTYVNRI